MLIAFGEVGLLSAQGIQPNRLPQIFNFGGPTAFLGIQMEDVTSENMARYKLPSETGVIIRLVEKGSPAEAARLQADDVILEYAGIPVFSAAQLSTLVQETPVNRNVNLGISREGKRMNVTVRVGERDLGSAPNLQRIAPNRTPRPFLDPGGTAVVPRSSGRRLDDLISSPRLQLGIEGVALTDQLATHLGASGKKGVLVTSVTPGAPAASVLHAGDVILSLDGKSVGNTSDIATALSAKEPGSKAEFNVLRDKREMKLTVEFPKAARK